MSRTVKKGDTSDFDLMINEIRDCMGFHRTLDILEMLEQLRSTKETVDGYIGVLVKVKSQTTDVNFKEKDMKEMKTRLNKEPGDMTVLYGLQQTDSGTDGIFFVMKKELLQNALTEYRQEREEYLDYDEDEITGICTCY